jgi:hypothetical protein
MEAFPLWMRLTVAGWRNFLNTAYLMAMTGQPASLFGDAGRLRHAEACFDPLPSGLERDI